MKQIRMELRINRAVMNNLLPSQKSKATNYLKNLKLRRQSNCFQKNKKNNKEGVTIRSISQHYAF